MFHHSPGTLLCCLASSLVAQYEIVISLVNTYKLDEKTRKVNRNAFLAGLYKNNSLLLNDCPKNVLFNLLMCFDLCSKR